MKKIILASLLLACVGSSFQLFAKSEEALDQIVAVVNEEVITTSELNSALNTARMQIAQENLPAPADAVLHKQVLDQLINRRLQLQLAKQTNIQVADTDVGKAIQRIAEQNHLTVNELYDRLQTEGMSSDHYRNEIRDQMIMQRLQQKEIIGRITITPQEVDQFIHSHNWKNNDNKEYRLDDILIPVADAPTPEEIADAKKHADTVMVKLTQGQSFESVAQAESAEKHALKGGDLGWRKIPEIPSAFAERVATMQKAQLAGPIQTPNGFHIIRLADVRATGPEQTAPKRDEIRELLLRRKFEEAMQNWVSKLRKQAFITMNTDQKKGSSLS